MMSIKPEWMHTMYVNGPGAIKNLDKTKKKAKSTSSGGGFGEVLNSTDDTAESSPAGAAGALSSVNSLFTLQEVGDEQRPSQKIVAHGHDILDALEDIRLALLTQQLMPSTLQNLQQRLGHWKEQYDDPKLQNIINEIELRAAVELAKLSNL